MREKSRTCSVGPRPLLHMWEKSRTCSVGPRPLLHMREKSWTCSVGPRPLLHMREKPWTSVGPRPLLHMREKRSVAAAFATHGKRRWTCSVGPRFAVHAGKAMDLFCRSAAFATHAGKAWTCSVGPRPLLDMRERPRTYRTGPRYGSGRRRYTSRQKTPSQTQPLHPVASPVYVIVRTGLAKRIPLKFKSCFPGATPMRSNAVRWLVLAVLVCTVSLVARKTAGQSSTPWPPGCFGTQALHDRKRAH